MATKQMSHSLRRIIEEQINLPSPPAIAVQILKTVQREDSSLTELARIISGDPVLSGKILSLANSGYYSMPQQVTTIERAIAVLGTNAVKNIALSFVIAEEFSGSNQTGFDYDYFWRRSVTCGVAAELLNNSLNIGNDELFVIGLLHNLGVLLIYLNKREEYTELLKERRTTGIPLHELESSKFGFTHQDVGFLLLTDWDLPKSITLPINYHHRISDCPTAFRRTTEILGCTDLLSAIYSETETVARVTMLQGKMIELFDLDAQQVRSLLDEVAQKSVSILKSFDLDPADLKPYSQMLQEANAELGKMNLSYEQMVMNLKEAKAKAEQLSSDLQIANNKLKELVSRDGLTGLFNHRHFQEQLDLEISRAQRYRSSLSLLMCDLDGFKEINDSFGHQAGDQVLINIAREIKTKVRPSDIIARYGGEEFAIILPETNQQGMELFAERMRRHIEGCFTKVDSQKISVTVSIGGTTLPEGRTDIGKMVLIDTADQALYLSKQNGRNRVSVKAPDTPLKK